MPLPLVTTSLLKPLTAMAAASTGAAGGLGLLALIQARLAAGRPGEDQVGYTVDGAAGPDTGDELRVVWLGDSLAAGLGAISPDVSLPRLVASHADHPSRLHVFATPGATSVDVVANQLPALEQLRHGLAQVGHRVQAIGVSVGANDIAAFTSRRRLRRNLNAIVEAAEGIPVVFVSIPQLADALRLPHPLRAIASVRASWLDLEVRAVAERHPGVAYASVRRRPHWIGRQHRLHFLAADRFHPSGAGYAVWANWVSEAFERVLAAPEPVPAPA